MSYDGIEGRLAQNQFLTGNEPAQEDAMLFGALSNEPNPQTHPRSAIWYNLVKAFTPDERLGWVS